jgi:hypothetical protein
MRELNTEGNPRGEMLWDFVSSEKKKAHHDKVKARRKASRKQRKRK